MDIAGKFLQAEKSFVNDNVLNIIIVLAEFCRKSLKHPYTLLRKSQATQKCYPLPPKSANV